jgi:hypothetical protein
VRVGESAQAHQRYILTCSIRQIDANSTDNARFLYGAQYIYIITTARDLDTSTGLYTGQAARALLVRYRKDREGKGQVLRIGEHHGSGSEKPQSWRAILHLHTVLNMSVEEKRSKLGSFEE